jgi:predicted DNA-binding transcriptional regulator AlpA
MSMPTTDDRIPQPAAAAERWAGNDREVRLLRRLWRRAMAANQERRLSAELQSRPEVVAVPSATPVVGSGADGLVVDRGLGMRPNSRLKAAVVSPARPAVGNGGLADPAPGAGHVVEPLLSTADWLVVLGISRRAFERLRARGLIPKPDVMLGRLPRWKAATVRAWIDGGGRI